MGREVVAAIPIHRPICFALEPVVLCTSNWYRHLAGGPVQCTYYLGLAGHWTDVLINA